MHSQIRKIIATCIILVILTGIPEASATEQEMRAAMQGFQEAFNAHDLAQAGLYWTDDIVYDFVPLPPPMQSKEQATAFLEGLFQGIPDFNVTQTRILVSDNIMVTEAVGTGTHLGELSGIPATGNSLKVLPLHIWEFEGDKVKRTTEYLDMASSLIQMGVMPAPELDPALLVPSFPLPDPEPTGLAPLEAAAEFVSRWNTRDLSGMSKMIHSDANILVAPLGIPLSRDAYVVVGEMMLQGFSDMPMEVVRAIDMGDGWVLSELLITGTNDGPYMGMPATRRSITLRAASLQRYNADGLLMDVRSYYDNLTMLAQLGFFPPPDPEANKAIVERWLELWNTQDLAIADEILATDFIPHTPHFPHIIDFESYKAEVTNTPTLIPDFHATLEDIVAEG
ncbi:MAG: ester cyclase, partial [Phycisphaerales bacterium]